MVEKMIIVISIVSVTYTLYLALKDFQKRYTLITGKNIRYKEKTKRIICMITFIVMLGFVTMVFIVGMKKTYVNRYNYGLHMMNGGDYEQAQEIFEDLDESKMYQETLYNYAKMLYNDGNLQEASRLFEQLGDYKSSETYLKIISLNSIIDANDDQDDQYIQYIQYIQNSKYSVAVNLYDEGKFSRALYIFEELGDYKDSIQMKDRCIKAMQEASMHSISAGISMAMGIDENGKIVSAGYVKPFDFENWNKIISISNLGIIAIGLKEDGTVITTGELSVDVSEWEEIVAVAAGERYVVGLRSDGTVVGAGHDQGDGQLQVAGWTDIIAIAAGWRHTVGLDSDGEVHITGYGSARQLSEINESSEWENIVAIAAGGGGDTGKGHTVGLRSDGTVVAVGDNTYGQCNVSEWKNIIAIAAGDWHTVGLCADGTVVSTKPDADKYPNLYTGACDVEDLEGIVEIAAGCGYTICLKDDGTVKAFGFNDSLQREQTEDWEKIKTKKVDSYT